MADRFEFCRLGTSGLRVGYVSMGSGPLVLFLHGFPDTYRGFVPAMKATASTGFCAVAPEPRGYAPTDIPRDGDYRIATYARDVLDLADALGARRFSIVGHDWGALTGYAVANAAPDRIERLVTAGVPHTGHFLLGIRWRQAVRSAYMAFFQLPGWPEFSLRRNDFEGLERLIMSWSPNWSVDDSMLDPLKDSFRDFGRLQAAIASYRGLPGSLMSKPSRQLVFGKVSVPTRILYGVDDGCIAPDSFQRQQRWFTYPVEVLPMIGSGHFMQWEHPEEFTERVLDFLCPK